MHACVPFATIILHCYWQNRKNDSRVFRTTTLYSFSVFYFPRTQNIHIFGFIIFLFSEFLVCDSIISVCAPETLCSGAFSVWCISLSLYNESSVVFDLMWKSSGWGEIWDFLSLRRFSMWNINKQANCTLLRSETCGKTHTHGRKEERKRGREQERERHNWGAQLVPNTRK